MNDDIAVTALQVEVAIFCQRSVNMDLGISIAVYLVLSLLFLTLICLLPRYFYYKIKSAPADLTPSDAMTEELQSHSSLEEEEDLNEHALAAKEKSHAKSPFFNNTKFEIELDDMKDAPKEIVGGSALMKKLNNQLVPPRPEKLLSKNSLREIKANQLSSNKFMNSRLGSNESEKAQIYKFVSKLVSYEQKVITVIEVDMRSIKKDQANNVIQDKKIEHYQVKMKEEGEEAFCRVLESLQFGLHQYGAFKCVTKVHTNDMAKNAEYQLKSLKTSESTDWISQQQFRREQQALMTYI